MTYRVVEFLGWRGSGRDRQPIWVVRARNLPWDEAERAWRDLVRARVLREPDGLEVARRMANYSWVLTSEVYSTVHADP
jgi:hypothetical protein